MTTPASRKLRERAARLERIAADRAFGRERVPFWRLDPLAVQVHAEAMYERAARLEAQAQSRGILGSSS